MKRSFILATLLLAALGLHASPQADLPAAGTQARALYRAGHEALDRQDWIAAVRQFRALEAELGDAGSSGRDAALYWQAWALARSGDRAGAVGFAQKLLAQFPDSAWADDAAELLGAPGDDDGARLMALDALLVSTPEKAVPILTEVLAGHGNEKIKKRALFILVQLAPQAAGDAIEGILAGNASATLKREAIQTLALVGDAAATERLVAYYRRESDATLKRAVIDAGLLGGRTELVLALARSETDAELQSHAIRVLGALGEATRVAELLPALRDADASRSAIDTLAIAGATEVLAGVVRAEGPLPLRLHAVRALSMATSEQRLPALIGLYREQSQPELRRALLHALSASGEPEALEAIGAALR